MALETAAGLNAGQVRSWSTARCGSTPRALCRMAARISSPSSPSSMAASCSSISTGMPSGSRCPGRPMESPRPTTPASGRRPLPFPLRFSALGRAVLALSSGLSSSLPNGFAWLPPNGILSFLPDFFLALATRSFPPALLSASAFAGIFRSAIGLWPGFSLPQPGQNFSPLSSSLPQPRHMKSWFLATMGGCGGSW